jgi:hypothetical protein
MNSRSALRKFRPAIERCESRDLAAAGLTSVGAHAAVSMRAPDADQMVEIFVRNATNPRLKLDFTAKVYVGDKLIDSVAFPRNFDERRIFDGSKGLRLFRFYAQGTPQPTFKVEYQTKPGDIYSLTLSPALPAGGTYKFISDGKAPDGRDKIKLV